MSGITGKRSKRTDGNRKLQKCEPIQQEIEELNAYLLLLCIVEELADVVASQDAGLEMEGDEI